PAHSGAMGQEAAEIWTAETALQPGPFLPPTLLARTGRSSLGAGGALYGQRLVKAWGLPLFAIGTRRNRCACDQSSKPSANNAGPEPPPVVVSQSKSSSYSSAPMSLAPSSRRLPQ